MITTRWARPEDLEAIAQIHARCFPGPDGGSTRAERLRDDCRFDFGDMLVAETDGRIVGGAVVIPQRVWTGGAEHPAGGVASVQVHPDFRRLGIARKVMGAILDAHLERGYGISMLYPFSPPFYRRLGYAPVGGWLLLRLRTAELVRATGERPLVRTAAADDLDAIIACHARSLEHHNGGIARSRGVWEQRILSATRKVAVYERNGRVEGYFIYELLPTKDHLQQTLYVREFVALDDEAERHLFAHIGAQHAQCPEVRFFAPPDSRLPLLLAEPRSPDYENPLEGRYTSGLAGTGLMARVVDPAVLFRAKRRYEGPHFSCRFRVFDKNPADGSETVREVSVEFDGTSAHVVENHPSAWLECDPGTMAQIYFGALSPRTAVRWGAAQTDSPETTAALDALFDQEAPFIHPLDFF